MEDETIKARDKASTLNGTNIWKIRQKKAYPEATNHIYLGKVYDENPRYVAMDCVTFHFGKKVDNIGNKDIVTGMRRIRRIPWSQIEVIHDIDADFDFTEAELAIDDEGTAVFSDGKLNCIITKRSDRLK